MLTATLDALGKYEFNELTKSLDKLQEVIAELKRVGALPNVVHALEEIYAERLDQELANYGF